MTPCPVVAVDGWRASGFRQDRRPSTRRRMSNGRVTCARGLTHTQCPSLEFFLPVGLIALRDIHEETSTSAHDRASVYYRQQRRRRRPSTVGACKVSDEYIGFNGRLAAALTRRAGSMWVVYFTIVFMLAWMGLATFGRLRECRPVSIPIPVLYG